MAQAMPTTIDELHAILEAKISAATAATAATSAAQITKLEQALEVAFDKTAALEEEAAVRKAVAIPAAVQGHKVLANRWEHMKTGYDLVAPCLSATARLAASAGDDATVEVPSHRLRELEGDLACAQRWIELTLSAYSAGARADSLAIGDEYWQQIRSNVTHPSEEYRKGSLKFAEVNEKVLKSATAAVTGRKKHDEGASGSGAPPPKRGRWQQTDKPAFQANPPQGNAPQQQHQPARGGFPPRRFGGT
ncbi:hypothetical protein HXX76_015872 [Chlamydomonas incerta]|uniref:Uncharacterized protein n=1 Tax=Chlamydomonas incerta TaxID=51695 RepID=A0A835VMT9_CHLIN|nr:hypothetical protein HXX76_015872 [Chlamydomonas incerta]|eukprot:KAG2422667.1 hypothetical protein HXX76_015872 [Chlamydomonas incerta]